MVATIRPELVGGVPAPRPKTLKPSELHSLRDDLSGLLAHDLKTPLAAIAMNVDFALSELEPDTADALRSALEDCRQANARALRIVTDMADAVRLMVGDRKSQCGDVPLARVVEEVVLRARIEASGRSVRIQFAVDGAVVRADGELIERALDRLVERALRHARGGSCVDVEQRGASITVRVETMSDPNLELQARSLATYFVDAAMKAQGGSLTVGSEGPGVLVFRALLP